MDFLQKKLLMSENGNDDDQRQVRPRLNEGEIIEVEGGHIIRSVGRKDRHSKVFTAKGPRDRRVRLSALTAIQFYDVQDRLGYDRPSKAVDWLIKHAKSAIDELDRFNPPSSKQYQRIPPKNNNLQDDHHQFQFSQDQMPANSRALARDRARERAKERSSNINTTAPDHTANNFSKFPQHQQQGDHNFNSNYVDQSNDILLHQNNKNGDDKSNSDQRHRTTKAQSLNVISTDDHHHDDHPAMQQNHDQVMNSIQNYVNLPGSVTNQVADLRLSLMQRPALKYLSFLQNPTTPNCLNMMMIRPGPSGMHHRLMRPVQTFSPSSGFDPSTSSHHHQQYPGLGISAAHRHDNNYNDNSTNNVVLQSDHHHDPGLHRHQYNFFNSGSHIDSAALHASAFELHHDQSSAYTTTSAFPAVRGTLQSIGGSAAAPPARARSHPSSISAVINNSNNNHSAPAGNNIEQHHDRTCNSIQETAGAFTALIPGFAGDHESHDQNDVKPSTC